MSKKALIIGVDGQDGTIAFDYLVKKKFTVIGVGKTVMRSSGIRAPKHFSITDQKAVERLIRSFKPDHIYFLAAYHHSSQDAKVDDKELMEKSYAIHVTALLYFLEAIQKYAPVARLFYAGSSLMFGNAQSLKQNERTPFNPNTVYGITKVHGARLCEFYRRVHGVFVSVGILYNHESAYRTNNFVSKKIINAALAIKSGKQKALALGDLDAAVDWGYAPDYVDAMYKILTAKKADNFVVATGKLHTVKDLAAATFSALSLNWKKYVVVDKSVVTRQRRPMIGDATKLRRATGWKPQVDFTRMVKLIIKELNT